MFSDEFFNIYSTADSNVRTFAPATHCACQQHMRTTVLLCQYLTKLFLTSAPVLFEKILHAGDICEQVMEFAESDRS